MTGAWERSEARYQLATAIDTLGLAPPPGAPDLLLDLCELLAAWAGRMNLTAHRTPRAILDRLVLDATALASVLPDAATLADLGAGPGIPGLPLAILFPQRRLTLVEARERRHHFQREAVRRLGLGNVRPVLGRSDELDAEEHEGVLAQAMARPRKALPLLLPWAAPGAWLALPGGATAPDPGSPPGVAGACVRRYHVPITGVERTVWIGRRCADTT